MEGGRGGEVRCEGEGERGGTTATGNCDCFSDKYISKSAQPHYTPKSLNQTTILRQSPLIFFHWRHNNVHRNSGDS